MNPLCILFPAVGGEPTLAAVPTLQADWPGPLRCIGTDSDESKARLLDLDHFEVAPPRSARHYVSHLMDLCKRHAVDVIWPNPTEEQLLLASHLPEIVLTGVRVLMPPTEAVAVFADKARTYEFAADLGLPVPSRRRISCSADVPVFASELGYPKRPVVFRRTQGRGAAGLRILAESPEVAADLFESTGGGRYLTVRSLLDILDCGTHLPDCMLCEYLPGKEYDVDCIYDRKGFVASVVRENKRMWGGTSAYAEVVDRPDLEALAVRLLDAVGWRFVGSVSFRENVEGAPVLMEVNPRMPSSINLTSRAGCPMPTHALLDLLEQPSLPIKPIEKGLRVIRYLGEHIYSP